MKPSPLDNATCHRCHPTHHVSDPHALATPTIVESPAAPVMPEDSSGAAHLLPTGIPRLDEAIRLEAETEAESRLDTHRNIFDVYQDGPEDHLPFWHTLDGEHREYLIECIEREARDLSRSDSYDWAKRLLARLLGWPETVEGPTWRHRHVMTTKGYLPAWVLGGFDNDFYFVDEMYPGITDIRDEREALIAALVAVARSA